MIGTTVGMDVGACFGTTLRGVAWMSVLNNMLKCSGLGTVAGASVGDIVVNGVGTRVSILEINLPALFDMCSDGGSIPAMTLCTK